jgi:hypothetical protein
MSNPAESVHDDIARQLLESIRLEGAAADAHLERAVAPDYWRSLVPDLSVGADPIVGFDLPALDPHQRQRTLDLFAENGYLMVDSLLPVAILDRMRRAVVEVMAADWPAVFTWVYDEFWRLPRVRPLVDLFAGALGPGYRQTSNFWTHFVAATRGAAGWPPHVDHHGRDTRLTVWIPLSPATVESGCMCVLPKSVLPLAIAKQWSRDETLRGRHALAALHGVRPLPAMPGSVLAWNAELLHWGATRQAAGDPRISFSLELVEARSDLIADERALPVSDALPTHQERLAMIARALVNYQSAEPRTSRYRPLATRLLDRLSAP